MDVIEKDNRLRTLPVFAFRFFEADIVLVVVGDVDDFVCQHLCLRLARGRTARLRRRRGLACSHPSRASANP